MPQPRTPPRRGPTSARVCPSPRPRWKASPLSRGPHAAPPAMAGAHAPPHALAAAAACPARLNQIALPPHLDHPACASAQLAAGDAHWHQRRARVRAGSAPHERAVDGRGRPGRTADRVDPGRARARSRTRTQSGGDAVEWGRRMGMGMGVRSPSRVSIVLRPWGTPHSRLHTYTAGRFETCALDPPPGHVRHRRSVFRCVCPCSPHRWPLH